MTETRHILSRVTGPIATVTFNNPDRRNAMSLEMWIAAAEAIQQLSFDHGVRVIVLTGAGGNAFVSGADISKFESERASSEAVATYNAATDHLQSVLLNCDKPTIALIRGYCIGGGVNIAAACDFRICNEESRFAIPAAKLGLGYGYASVRRLLDLMAPQFVAEMLVTARQFTAQDALRIGFVNRVVQDAEIEAVTGEFAADIAANAPLTITAAKATIREALKDHADRNVLVCDRLIQQCFASQDYAEGRSAFLEKRKPAFKGH